MTSGTRRKLQAPNHRCEIRIESAPLFQLTWGNCANFCSRDMCLAATSSATPVHEPVARCTRTYQVPAIAKVTTNGDVSRSTIEFQLRCCSHRPLAPGNHEYFREKLLPA